MQIHSDSQKRRLFCVSRFAPFYTKQAPLLPAGDLRRYVLIIQQPVSKVIKMDKQVFISYCWANETDIDLIDNSFLSDGITLIRDKRETEYKDSFKEFMKTIRKTDYVLMVISDQYLKSKNCMFEVLEVLKDENYKSRILPIVLDNGNNIYSPAGPLKYLEFWDNEYTKLKTELSKYSPEDVISVTEDLKIIRNIRSSIVDFVRIISDLKNIPFDELKINDFNEIKQVLGVYPESISKIRYDILNQEDVSHAGAKRYSAKVLIDSKYSQGDIKIVIKEITENLKRSNYQLNKELGVKFKGNSTDVVWLFFANRMSDVHNSNWRCRTNWINDELDPHFRPTQFEGNDSVGDIKIEWNSNYKEMADFYDNQIITKAEFIETIDKLLTQTKNITKPLINLFHEGVRADNEFTSLSKYIQKNNDDVDTIINVANDISIPPHDCQKLDKLTQSFFAISHNIFLYYSDSGLNTWDDMNRIKLMHHDILLYQDLELKITAERKDI